MTDVTPGELEAPAVPDMQPKVGPGSPALTDGKTRPDVIAVTANLIRAADNMATKAIASQDGRDGKDFAQAALYFAQAVITIDPSRDQGGQHPEATRQARLPTPTPRNDDEGDEGGDHRSPRPPRATPKRGAGTVDRDHDGKIGES